MERHRKARKYIVATHHRPPYFIVYGEGLFHGTDIYLNRITMELSLRPPAHPFEAILLYDRNQLKLHVILSFRLPKPYIR